MNIPGIDLGEALTAFKAETEKLKAPYRGKLLGSNAFIRNIHNSFARYALRTIPKILTKLTDTSRRMDVLNADLALVNEMKKVERAKKNTKKSTRKAKEEEEDEAGFHFLAYVPINGVVWKLDGLQRQPDNLGNLLTLTAL